MNSSSELEELFKSVKEVQGKKASFLHQTSALMSKNASFYRRNWASLLVQFLITAVFLLGKLIIYSFHFLLTYSSNQVMFAMGGRDVTKYTNNLRPPIRPAPAPLTEPIRLTIPFGPNITGLGSCCDRDSSSGLLSHIDFSILAGYNSSYFT